MLNPIYFRVNKNPPCSVAGAGPPALAGTSRPPREQRSFATAAGKSLGWEAQRRRDGWLRYVG